MKKILVIEDDDGVADLLEVLLEGEGYKVISSTKALPLADVAELSPDLILLDHLIEGGFGSDYCINVKANPGTQHIPVLIVSAVPKLEKIAKDSCADGYLEKPFDINTLISKVSDLLK